MSLALFRSELRTAVREAVGAACATPARPRPAEPKADLLRHVARGELSVEAALKALESLP